MYKNRYITHVTEKIGILNQNSSLLNRAPGVRAGTTVHEKAPCQGPGQSAAAKGVEDVLPAQTLGYDAAQHQGQRASSRHSWGSIQ